MYIHHYVHIKAAKDWIQNQLTITSSNLPTTQ